MERGRVKRRVGWRPVGSRKVVEYSVLEVEGAKWWREGNENRVGSAMIRKEWPNHVNYILNFLSCPITARKPPNESSSG